MALRRCTRPVDGTIPIPALLYDDEELLASQDGVGIYDGQQKSENHQSGTIHVSTHRLFYIAAQKRSLNSFVMDMSHVTQTEYYAGLFKSSPKVTLHLSTGNSAGPFPGSSDVLGTEFESWECELCAYRNPPGLSPAAAKICGLCGVPRSSVLPASASRATTEQHLSSSLPSASSPLSVSAAAQSTGPISHDGRRPSSIACTACTFLNHPSLRSCEICGTELPRIPESLGMKSAPSSRPASPDIDDDDSSASGMIKISFRKGGDKAFYAVLKRGLKSKAWEAAGIGGKTSVGRSPLASGSTTNLNAVGRSGITGIMRTVETNAQGRETDMKDALQDLEALMIKARDMVRLAADLNERLTASSTTTTTTATLSDVSSSSSASMTTLVPSTEPEEATFIRSSLSQLGLQMSNAPVTLDMIKDERKWHEELARELAGVLQGSPTSREREKSGMMKDRGIIALDEIWGGWNRARGVALIPPPTFLQVIPHLPVYTNPSISSRTFSSGLSVLHTPPYGHAAFSARLSGSFTLSGPKTTTEIAHEERITVGLATEMIAAVEADGDVCRDDPSNMIKGGGAGEIRWWSNMFIDYIWDGQEDSADDPTL